MVFTLNSVDSPSLPLSPSLPVCVSSSCCCAIPAFLVSRFCVTYLPVLVATGFLIFAFFLVRFTFVQPSFASHSSSINPSSAIKIV
ncbi:hypothetical protein DFP72DRAFT_34749 [Ephemerocybe angulata]|uniref:Uncharacterized protein n=1 Tax=Ephemerocybe angulata TaxID=980116 RepID=A0A8H6IB42_9AGAR|nr:hypothetical protein DFP72DRAFT_34749 [Tulosesus angulatus]